MGLGSKPFLVIGGIVFVMLLAGGVYFLAVGRHLPEETMVLEPLQQHESSITL